MKPLRIVGIFVTLLLAGCLAKGAGTMLAPGQIDVFGVALHSATDYREINGVSGSDEPCLRGYERSFEPLDIVLGYGRDGKIRKITTRNRQNSMFGVRIGDVAETARANVRAAGFAENGAPDRFSKDDLTLTFLVDNSGKVFGLTLEVTGPG